MSLLKEGDVLRIRIVRNIGGKLFTERLDINERDVRYFSTPELLRHFVECVSTVTQRLDLTEEYVPAQSTIKMPKYDPLVPF